MATTKKYVSLEKLSLYDEKIKKVITDGDAASLTSAKSYADSLATNYDVAGSAATVQGKLDEEVLRAKAAEEANATAAKKAQDEVDALELVVAEKADKTALDATQAEVNALETLVGDIPVGDDGQAVAETVIAYVDKKTEGIATDAALGQLQTDVNGVKSDVATIKGDYLKAADKTELSDAIAAEKARAEGVEGGLDTRVKAIEDDYLKAADKTALEESIAENASAIERLTNGVSQEEIDGVNDLIAYVNEHGTEVTGMKEDISENAAAIAAEKTRAEAEEAKNAQAAAAAQTAAEEAQAAADAEAERAKGVEGGLETRLQAVEAQLGDGDNSVAELIATAKQEAIDAAAQDATTKANTAESNAKAYTDTEVGKDRERISALETASATHALKSEVEAVAGRVTTAEGEIDTLQTEMDAVEALAAANKSAHEANAAAIALKAAQTDLDAAVSRIAAVETWQANMVECSEEDINGLFA